jgi:hypothetical protein
VWTGLLWLCIEATLRVDSSCCGAEDLGTWSARSFPFYCVCGRVQQQDSTRDSLYQAKCVFFKRLTVTQVRNYQNRSPSRVFIERLAVTHSWNSPREPKVHYPAYKCTALDITPSYLKRVFFCLDRGNESVKSMRSFISNCFLAFTLRGC